MTISDVFDDIFELDDHICDQCSMPLNAEPLATSAHGEIRVVWVCPTHGAVAIVNPF